MWACLYTEFKGKNLEEDSTNDTTGKRSNLWSSVTGRKWLNQTHIEQLAVKMKNQRESDEVKLSTPGKRKMWDSLSDGLYFLAEVRKMAMC